MATKVIKGQEVFEKYDMNKICNRIRFAICMEQISHIQLAKEIGVSRDCIFRYTNLNFPEKSMNIEILKRIAEYFHKDRHYFCNSYHIFLDTVDGKEFLKNQRKELGITQKEYANKLGINLGIYKKYESGETKISEYVWSEITNMKV